jgi:hypothetical protein
MERVSFTVKTTASIRKKLPCFSIGCGQTERAPTETMAMTDGAAKRTMPDLASGHPSMLRKKEALAFRRRRR